jgi:hypothetical protein
MARSRSVAALLIAYAVGALSGPNQAQPPPDRRPPGERPGVPEPRRPFMPRFGPEADEARERAMRELQKLSPEKRIELWRTVMAVLNLPPEKRQMILGFDEERRRKAQEEMVRAMEENGLKLDEEKRKEFFRRYFDERRAIEERLRKEADEKRPEMLRAMRERLKAEFSAK